MHAVVQGHARQLMWLIFFQQGVGIRAFGLGVQIFPNKR
jgi:hypothetical protein